MNTRSTIWALVPATVLMTAVFSYDDGTIPGQGSIAADSARRGPSCTSCHSGTIGSNGVAVQMSAPSRSLNLGESLTVSLGVTGGPGGSRGGFAAENTAGTFTARSGQLLNRNGRTGQFISHSSDRSRSWSLSYAAPSSPGLVKLYAVAMAANGSGRSGDSIAFNGFDPSATDCTPVYFGVNAAGNSRFGQGCIGSFGNWPVLYSDETPNIGNQNYGVKLAGAAPNSTVLFMFGVARVAPLPLDLIGATGCGLWVDSIVSVQGATSAGHPQRGEGTATSPLPLPNDNSLRGIILGVQAAVVDVQNGRRLPITMTDGLLFSIQ